MKLIGIHGHAGSGKDTIAEYLMNQYNSSYYSFADPLKEAAARMFGIDEDEFYNPTAKEIPNDFWKVSPRQIAQFVGTEMVRDTIERLLPEVGKDFWIRRMNKTLKDAFPSDTLRLVTIPDVRFQNELDWVLSNNGIIIHLTRPGADGTVGIPNHSSEAKLDTERSGVYHVHNDSTLDDLFDKVNDILSQVNFITI